MASTGMEEDPTGPMKHSPTPFVVTASGQMQRGAKHVEQNPLVILNYLD